MQSPDCVYCQPKSEAVLWSDARCRVLHVTDTGFAGFCRVVWNDHICEFTDLDEAARAHVIKVVAAVESAQRKLLAPDKINIASLGNVVPHLHWHVIPRYRDDSHYPDPIWAAPRRRSAPRRLPGDLPARMKEAIDAALG
ncbi:MAG TPA: HIT family protein [Casimicrobiaceae bacterium]|nr:HIT family protein [Casimicrobiaceae bacterium]